RSSSRGDFLSGNPNHGYTKFCTRSLLTKYEDSGNAKALGLITQMSPAAWRHILLNGHYTFQSDGKMIDLDALVAELELS
ncbi:hypothetical protein, partial [Xanthomonas citri]|uniref:hypothetical protein n=1 Tax=Xanthomonas citri TaxID=346 RepID=UPI00131BAE2F